MMKATRPIEIRNDEQSMVSNPIDAPLANGLRKAKTQSFILEFQ